MEIIRSDSPSCYARPLFHPAPQAPFAYTRDLKSEAEEEDSSPFWRQKMIP